MSLLKRLSKWKKQMLPPVTMHRLRSHYVPMCGAISHACFTINVFNPQLLADAFGEYDLLVSNGLLMASHWGLGFYFYDRPHINDLSLWNRFEPSLFATLMFNFGSTLMTVLLRKLFPDGVHMAVRVLFAASFSWLLLSRGHKYMHHIDSRCRRSPLSLRVPECL